MLSNLSVVFCKCSIETLIFVYKMTIIALFYIVCLLEIRMIHLSVFLSILLLYIIIFYYSYRKHQCCFIEYFILIYIFAGSTVTTYHMSRHWGMLSHVVNMN